MLGRLNICDFVCWGFLRAKSSLHWSDIHYQATFERHSRRGYESTIIILSQSSVTLGCGDSALFL